MNLTLNTIDVQYQLVQDAQTLKSACQFLATVKVIGIDTETTGLDPRTHQLRLVQIAAKGIPVMIVDLAAIPVDKLKPLKQLLTNGSTKVFHNGKFDWSFLSMANLQPTGPYFDTQLASQVLFAGLKKSHTLAALASKLLKTELNKDLQHSDFSGKLSNDQLEYAAILLPLQKILYAHLKRASLLPTAFLEFEAMPAVAQMELNGMQLDHQKWLAVSLDLEAKKQAAALQLKELKIRHSSQLSLLPEYTDRVNLESPQQVLAALKSKGIPLTQLAKKP